MTVRKATKPAPKGARAGAKKPQPKPERGRPTVYRPEYAEQARKLYTKGATDVEVADFFGVTVVTLWRWRMSNDDFCKASRVGREAANERVVASLYHRAIGYTFQSEKIFQFQGDIIRAKTREHVPPDFPSMSFWLRNNDKANWSDKPAPPADGDEGQEQSALDAALDAILTIRRMKAEKDAP